MVEKHHMVYQTTNLINDKTYVGVHSTWDLGDDYLGSGKVFLQAIKKHGKENFKREWLYMGIDKEDAYAKEAEIVDENFVARRDTYNIKLGGIGGDTMSGKNHTEESIELMRQKALKAWENRPRVMSEEQKNKIGDTSRGRKASIETRKKMSVNNVSRRRWTCPNCDHETSENWKTAHRCKGDK